MTTLSLRVVRGCQNTCQGHLFAYFIQLKCAPENLTSPPPLQSDPSVFYKENSLCKNSLSKCRGIWGGLLLISTKNGQCK